MLYVLMLLVAVIAYLLGSISSSILISKKIAGVDIRTEGSGNAGTTNMLRMHGKKAAALTLLFDVLKGVVAVLIAMLVDWCALRFVDGSSLTYFENAYLLGNLKYIAGFFAVLGHDFPIFFGFRGGKGIATSLGVMLMFDWRIGLIVLVVSVLIMLISRYVSLGSVIGAIVYPCAVLAFMAGRGFFNATYVAAAVLLGVIAIIKHYKNIKRLLNGTENKLFAKKNEPVEVTAEIKDAK
ncbi:MAG TPA: glycerol-3-phosphate 1-O-acyltransferase PlsY [Candidatus Avimonoglobus intestinipullorum]|uniref:Glycerol-3-phosphate acyltransferase n=1 Tax=Candidatus Avimonoglobus intestinipullorum TaxID=2840699 RepID=A0A9D1LV62_9FIRM|nr:glycerol-3-phosphate 1-O-acyltransferase PlsY [Candidatus Avimonoglobus intestinipullorum]